MTPETVRVTRFTYKLAPHTETPMTKSIRFALAFFILTIAFSAAAEVRKDTRAGISYDIPSWWEWEPREEGVVMATKDGTLVVMLWAPRGETLEEAIESLEDEIEKAVKGAKPDGEPTTGTLNGMQTVSISGKGRIDGKRAEYSVTILDAKRPVIIMAFGETGKYEKHEDALIGFLKSIRKLK